MNTNEIIVDKENIENKVNDMIKVIQEIKRGGSIQCLQDKIVISGEKDAIEIELPYLDVDAIKEQYPDAKISTVVLNGVTGCYSEVYKQA